VFNERAVRLFEWLRQGRRDSVATLLDDPGATEKLVRDWRTLIERNGQVQSVEALGTTRLDRGQFLTTVRIVLAGGGSRHPLIRFAWAAAHPVVNSEDGALPPFLGPFPESPIDAAAQAPYWWVNGANELLTYDLLTEQELRASVQRENGRVVALVFHLPGTDVVARRAQ
jgi:hypothetical protein